MVTKKTDLVPLEGRFYPREMFITALEPETLASLFKDEQVVIGSVLLARGKHLGIHACLRELVERAHRELSVKDRSLYVRSLERVEKRGGTIDWRYRKQVRADPKRTHRSHARTPFPR